MIDNSRQNHESSNPEIKTGRYDYIKVNSEGAEELKPRDGGREGGTLKYW